MLRSPKRLMTRIMRKSAHIPLIPPIAKKTSTKSEHANPDCYSWLRDEGYPKVENEEILHYLKEENDYAEMVLSSKDALIKDIYNEIKGRIKEDDSTVPVKKGEYFYYSYIKEGMEYWVHARKYKSLDANEEVILNENKLACDLDYCKIIGIKVSPNHKFMTYALDKLGNEMFEIYIKNLELGNLLTETIPNTFGQVVWHENNLGFFYVPASENWRAKKVYYHTLGTDYKNDQLLYEEKDATYSVSIEKTTDSNYLIITTQSKEENECYYIDLMQDDFTLKLFAPRQKSHLYSISSHEGKFYVLTNDMGKNFRIAAVDDPDKKWLDFIPYAKERYIRDFKLYQNHMVVTSSSNKNGLFDVEIVDLRSNASKNLAFPDSSYDVDVVFTTHEAESFRFHYSSLKTPKIVKEHCFESGEEFVLKTDEIPSGFNSDEYEVERLYAKSRDGKAVPISLIYRKDKFKKDGTNQLYLYGYGSYGYAVPLMFRRSIFSLLDRGFVYAISHIRGGDDLGYEWYESAKFLTKKNTFYDFIDSAEYLAKQGYTKEGEITIAGGSAGGMLIGFCINDKPELFKNAVAHVPFVDVLNTMLDANLPLTPGEFKEWGNPMEKEFYDYIKSYSPYDNVKKQKYPNLFVTAGLSDPRVTYWEPAKWVAKLRADKTDDNIIVLITNMDAGHAGKSGRYSYLWEIAKEYAFLI
ncbi:S9 family peptidase [Candidatus Bandiella woodruffii]|uniref:S9 family peptidase n=2 Tax=Candidatus Bandiella euplotis TaxID=1664265 RepID=A0ABZ0UQ53_9RICK|nr:S9 family peptidase [Candidatus Bandiella woodruffii]